MRYPILALLLMWSGVAFGRGYRIDMVPGGYTFECSMCHFRQPFRRLTVFGADVREHLLFRENYPEELPPDFFVGDEGNPDWSRLSQMDSDGDGYTNGEELGDPDGVFVQFDPQPEFPFTRPDLADDFPCGSGTVEGPEACDGPDLAGQTCAGQGFVGGVLACDQDCRFDTDACHLCGDGQTQNDEACDGVDLGEATCQTLGFEGGDLRCGDDCRLDTAICHRCGDGIVQDGEACDGLVPAEATCADRGEVGSVRCIQCRLDYAHCRPEEGGVPMPDGAPDMGLVDADLPDSSRGPLVDAEPDRGEASDGHRSSGDVHPPPVHRQPDTTAETGGCFALDASGTGPGFWLLVVYVMGRLRQRHGRDRSAS